MPVGAVLDYTDIYRAMNNLDRRVSVAPMMDWSDCAISASGVKQLDNPKSACPHSVSTLHTISNELQVGIDGVTCLRECRLK